MVCQKPSAFSATSVSSCSKSIWLRLTAALGLFVAPVFSAVPSPNPKSSPRHPRPLRQKELRVLGDLGGAKTKPSALSRQPSAKKRYAKFPTPDT
jgi:hypothetical protein